MTPRLWTFRLSPFSGKVRVAAAEKGVELELVEVDAGNRPPRLAELNVTGRVPVLELEDGVIRESSIICEWLEETHPEPPLWPADPTLRGWARGWAKWLDDELTANFFLAMRKFAYGKEPGDPDDVVERLTRRVPRRWGTLEAALAVHEGPWLTGGQFTFADVAGAAIAVRIPQWNADLLPAPDEAPLVTAWLAAMRERPSTAAIDAAGEPVLTG